MKNKYQMITVCDYLKMLDESKNKMGTNVKSGINKYLLSVQRAKTNAKILEKLLA